VIGTQSFTGSMATASRTSAIGSSPEHSATADHRTYRCFGNVTRQYEFNAFAFKLEFAGYAATALVSGIGSA